MRTTALIVALGILPLGSVTHAGDPRHYDCSKPGNANKAVCKGVTTPNAAPALASESAKAPAVASSKPARIYDCSKAGNKTKVACRAALAGASPAVAAPAPRPPPPSSTTASAGRTMASPSAAPVTAAPASGQAGAPRIVAWTEKNGKVVHYDCSKAGNLNKKACKAP